jgi:bile acid-coenzyme A ligase
MQIPLADVPRWYADRKPKDTIAISYGADALNWEQLERGGQPPLPCLAVKGVSATCLKEFETA